MNDKPSAGCTPGGLPPELERFGAQLERATSRQVTRARARRRVVSGAAIAAAAAIAVYAGVAVLGGSGGSGPAQVPTASALDKASAALHAPPGAILHVHMVGTQDNGDGTTVSWQDESWQSTSPPYQRRQIEQAPDEPRSESGTVDGSDAVYDKTTGTIYVDGAAAQSQAAPSPSPTTSASGPLVAIRGVDLKNAATRLKSQVSAGRLTTAQLRVVDMVLLKVSKIPRAPHGVTVVVGGKTGAVTIRWKVDGKPQSVSLDLRGSEAGSNGSSSDASSGASDDMFREQALTALKAPSTKAAGHVTIDGRDALKIVVSPSVTYLVDAQTYNPIEWITRGTTGGVTLHFVAYELLPPTAANLGLLSLTAQHPDAKLDTTPQDYDKAMGRLFPKG